MTYNIYIYIYIIYTLSIGWWLMSGPYLYGEAGRMTSWIGSWHINWPSRCWLPTPQWLSAAAGNTRKLGQFFHGFAIVFASMLCWFDWLMLVNVDVNVDVNVGKWYWLILVDIILAHHIASGQWSRAFLGQGASRSYQDLVGDLHILGTIYATEIYYMIIHDLYFSFWFPPVEDYSYFSCPVLVLQQALPLTYPFLFERKLKALPSIFKAVIVSTVNHGQPIDTVYIYTSRC